MRTLVSLRSALIALMAAAPLAAQQGGRVYRLDAGASRFWFEADATLGEFRGTASGADGWAMAGAGSDRISGARGAVQVHAATFRTGNGMRDGHLRDELDVERYPGITFELDSVAVTGAAGRVQAAGLTDPEGTPVVLLGRLTVRGRSTPVEVPALVSVADTIRIRGRLATRFTALGMEPPSRLLGVTKVRDPIVLGFEAVFVAGQ